jgi:hypothetical protein
VEIGTKVEEDTLSYCFPKEVMIFLSSIPGRKDFPGVHRYMIEDKLCDSSVTNKAAMIKSHNG